MTSSGAVVEMDKKEEAAAFENAEPMVAAFENAEPMVAHVSPPKDPRSKVKYCFPCRMFFW